MIFTLDGEGDPNPVVEQQTLARCLTRLATRLHGQSEADPVLVMETALAAIALTRTWLESDVILAALAAVPRDQLEWWDHELAEDEAYVAGLRDAVQAELGLSLRDRNRHGGRAETGGSIPVETQLIGRPRAPSAGYPAEGLGDPAEGLGVEQFGEMGQKENRRDVGHTA